jgi:hypothetical protein
LRSGELGVVRSDDRRHRGVGVVRAEWNGEEKGEHRGRGIEEVSRLEPKTRRNKEREARAELRSILSKV